MNKQHRLHASPPEVIRIALEDAPDATLIVDTAGTIRFANQTVTELFGHPHEGRIGRGVEILIPERFRTEHVVYGGDFTRDRQSRPMGGQRLDPFGLRPDGSEFPVAISLKSGCCEQEWFTVAARMRSSLPTDQPAGASAPRQALSNSSRSSPSRPR